MWSNNPSLAIYLWNCFYSVLALFYDLVFSASEVVSDSTHTPSNTPLTEKSNCQKQKNTTLWHQIKIGVQINSSLNFLGLGINPLTFTQPLLWFKSLSLKKKHLFDCRINIARIQNPFVIPISAKHREEIYYKHSGREINELVT